MAIIEVKIQLHDFSFFFFSQLSRYQKLQINLIRAYIELITFTGNDNDVLTQVDCLNVVDALIHKFNMVIQASVSFFLLIKQEFCLIFDRNAMRYMPMSHQQLHQQHQL
jgi:hypothetical protein